MMNLLIGSVSASATSTPPVVPITPYVVSEGTGAVIASGTTLDVPYPDTVASGDLLIMNTMSRSDITIPTGWTKLGEQFVTSSAGNQRGTAYYKAADGTESGTLTLTQGSSGRFLGIMQTVRGNVGTPVATWHNSDDPSSAGGVLNAGSVTGSVDLTLAIVCITIYLAGSVQDSNVEAGWTLMNPIFPIGNRLSTAQRDIDSTFFDSSNTWNTTSSTQASWHCLFINNPT